MQYRVRELDDIKAKVSETEANLQKRLDSKDEAIDLQVNVMLQEADGFGFFPGDNKFSGSALRYSRSTGPGVTLGLSGPAHLPGATGFTGSRSAVKGLSGVVGEGQPAETSIRGGRRTPSVFGK
jgi:hypothetical protein